MKRLLALFLALAVVFAFVACGNDGNDTTTDPSNTAGNPSDPESNEDNQTDAPSEDTEPSDAPKETVASGSEVVPDLPATSGSIDVDYTYPASDGSLEDDGE